MNENQFGDKVRHILDQGLEPDSAVAERLRAARARALAHQRPEPALALRWADNVLGKVGGWSGLSLRLVVPAAVLVASVATLYTWQQNQRIVAVEEIDALLLTDELPIDAYFDRGFQDWLKKRAAEQ